MNPRTKTIRLGDDISFDLVYVEGDSFMMGDDNSVRENEKPAHKVEVNSFYIGKHQVIQDVWQSVMGNDPFRFSGGRRPIERVSWRETQDFLQLLNRHTRQSFRLPTEAEWEYAARGGKYREDYLYAGSDKLKQVGWYEENSNGQTHEVGKLLANELGLYDMSGNVWEWCEDDYHDNYEGAPNDGSAWVDSPARSSGRVLRGGLYFDDAESSRSTFRSKYTADDRNGIVGFRLVLPVQSVG